MRASGYPARRRCEWPGLDVCRKQFDLGDLHGLTFVQYSLEHKSVEFKVHV